MLAFACIGVLIVELTLPFLGFFWHVTHRHGSVKWLEWSFRVPAKFFAVYSHADGHPVMISYSPVFPFFRPRSRITSRFAKQSMISILGKQNRYDEEPDYVQGYSAEQRYLAVESELVHEARLQGLTLQSKRTGSTAAGAVVCLEFEAPGVVRIRCYFKRDTYLAVLYDGEPQFSQEVYLVVRDIAPNR